jgi:hypothetical protein
MKNVVVWIYYLIRNYQLYSIFICVSNNSLGEISSDMLICVFFKIHFAYLVSEIFDRNIKKIK